MATALQKLLDTHTLAYSQTHSRTLTHTHHIRTNCTHIYVYIHTHTYRLDLMGDGMVIALHEQETYENAKETYIHSKEPY